MKKTFPTKPNLQTICYLKLHFQNWLNVSGKWLIHGTTHLKDDELQNLEPHIEHSSWKCIFNINESNVDMFK